MAGTLAIAQFPAVVVLFGYMLDIALGDPEGLSHPVRWIGGLIGALEGLFLKAASTPGLKRFLGAVMALITVFSAWAVAFFLMELARAYSAPVYYLVCSYIVWTSLATASLKEEAVAVVRALEFRGLGAARASLSRIVGRDTAALAEEDVMRAVVETVSENTSDGVVAPLFYLALGGPALMLAYKAVNTLDSMVGYKNERYEDFGWFSARLDDAANYIPARLTALLMVCASFILRYNWKKSLSMLLRDGRAHPSPNAGLPEAAAAGALGVSLGGGSFYNGVFKDKPAIGLDPASGAPDASTVTSSIRIMEATSLLMLALVVAVRLAL